MPVEGLPSTLEGMLNVVLQDNTVSSFKVDCRGDQTVVVVRLTANTSIHPPVTENGSVAYRRKCPSQVNRDRRRAEAHRTGREKKASVTSPSGLFMPTPPSLCYAPDHREKEPVSADVFSYTPCTSSAPLSSSDPPQHGQIDMSESDIDEQTVTVGLSCDENSNEAVLCECDGEREEEKSVNDSAECVASAECAGGLKYMGSIFETEKTVDEKPEITYHDLMQCLKEFEKNCCDKMDDLRHVLKETSLTTKTVKDGNLDRDVS